MLKLTCHRLEARIVALLGLDHKMLTLFDEKQDIHTITSSWIFNIPIDQVDSVLRFIGKTARHAGHYDMREHRLTELVNTDAKKYGIDISISEYKAGIILRRFHAFSPNIRGSSMNQSRKHSAIIIEFSLTLLDDTDSFMHEEDENSIRKLTLKFLNPLCQINLDELELEQRIELRREGVDFRFVVEAHDALTSIVLEKDLEAYRSIIHDEIERPIDFSRCTIKRDSLIIPAETKVGYNYRDCPLKRNVLIQIVYISTTTTNGNAPEWDLLRMFSDTPKRAKVREDFITGPLLQLYLLLSKTKFGWSGKVDSYYSIRIYLSF